MRYLLLLLTLIAGPVLAMAPKPVTISQAQFQHIYTNGAGTIEAAYATATPAQKDATANDLAVANEAWAEAKAAGLRGDQKGVNDAERKAYNASFSACKILTCRPRVF